MLKEMRRSAQKIVSKIILLLLIVSFISFFGYRNVTGCHPSAVAKVNGTLIVEKDYHQKLRQQLEVYRRFMQNQSNDEAMLGFLKRMVLDGMINQELLAGAARDARLRVGDNAVREQIQRAFTDPQGGKFDYEVYQKYVMQVLQMPPKRFEEQTRRELLATKVRELLSQSVKASTAEVQEQHNFENHEVSFDYLMLDPEKIVLDKTPSEDELKAYFDQNATEYQSEATRRMEYAIVHPKDLGLQPSKVDPKIGKDPAKAANEKAEQDKKLKAYAEELRLKLQGDPTQPFKTLAGNAKVRIGISDFFERKSTIPGIEDSATIALKAFEMRPRDISEPIKGWISGAYYLIRIIDEQPSRPLNLKEAQERVRLDVTKQAKTKLVETQLDQAMRALKAGKSVPDVSTQLKLAKGDTGFFKLAMQEAIPRIGISKEARDELATLSSKPGSSKKIADRPFDIGSKHYIFVASAERTASNSSEASAIEAEKKQLLAGKRNTQVEHFIKELRAAAEKQGKVVVYRLDRAEVTDFNEF